MIPSPQLPLTRQWRQRAGIGLLLAWMGWQVIGCAARDTSQPHTARKSEHASVTVERSDFNQLFEEWTRMLGELRDLELAFHTAPAGRQEVVARQHAQKLGEGYSLENELISAALRAFVSDPKENEDLQVFLIQISSLLLAAEYYEDSLRVSQLLVDNDVDDDRVYQNAADAAFACAEFDLMEQLVKTISKRIGEAAPSSERLSFLGRYKKEWERERRLREAEQLAGDLPRVLLVTARGEIELELFENEAPNTVANFITLVEKGFYDELVFHEVTPRLGARTGCPLGDGSGSPGYYIPHEYDHPRRRGHFRGSVTTVPEGLVANGSQFYLTFVPTPQWDDQNTVFGRVVRGLDVLASLQRRSTDNLSALVSPDPIYAAKVLRKRNHPYQADVVPDPMAKRREEISQTLRKLGSR